MGTLELEYWLRLKMLSVSYWKQQHFSWLQCLRSRELQLVKTLSARDAGKWNGGFRKVHIGDFRPIDESQFRRSSWVKPVVTTSPSKRSHTKTRRTQWHLGQLMENINVESVTILKRSKLTPVFEVIGRLFSIDGNNQGWVYEAFPSEAARISGYA